jgi:hypothetical protein
MRSITMKTIHSILALALLAGVAYGASVRYPATTHLGNEGKAHPATRDNPSTVVYLDTSEIDTGHFIFHALGSPIFTHIDTLGVFSFACKDSTGTDTLNIIGKWQGNPRCEDGQGVWENVDSVTYVGATSAAANPGIPASSSYANKSKVVVNTGGYCRYRFYLRNPFTTAARKAVCKDAVLIERPRAGYRP